jgi:hypothetical protein
LLFIVIHYFSSIRCLRRAILSTESPLRRAEFYCNLGRVFAERREFVRAQHCFIRAVQLRYVAVIEEVFLFYNYFLIFNFFPICLEILSL